MTLGTRSYSNTTSHMGEAWGSNEFTVYGYIDKGGYLAWQVPGPCVKLHGAMSGWYGPTRGHQDTVSNHTQTRCLPDTRYTRLRTSPPGPPGSPDRTPTPTGRP